jgi:hypothetical protein
MTPKHARKANEQIRRLRAGLIEARNTLRDHFGPLDESVKACEAALGEADHLSPATRRAVDKIRESMRHDHTI